MVAYMTKTNMVDRHTKLALALTLIGDVVFLTAIAINAAPKNEIYIEVAFAKDGIGLDLSIIACSDFCLQSVHIPTLLRNDIHHSSQGHTTIERRGWTTQHLNLLDLLQRHTEIRRSTIGGKIVQTVAIKHDEDFLLSVAIDATHGDVDVVVTVNDVHAWHVGCQHFPQVTRTTIPNHLGSNERSRHRHLGQTLSLTGGGSDSRCHTCLDVVHNIDKLSRVGSRRTVVWILLKHQRGVLLSLLDIETSQIAKGYQVERILPQIARERAEVLQQRVASLVYTTYLVVRLCLSIQLTHFRVVLRICHTCAEDE